MFKTSSNNPVTAGGKCYLVACGTDVHAAPCVLLPTKKIGVLFVGIPVSLHF